MGQGQGGRVWRWDRQVERAGMSLRPSKLVLRGQGGGSERVTLEGLVDLRTVEAGVILDRGWWNCGSMH